MGYAAFLPALLASRPSLPNRQLLELHAGEGIAWLVAGGDHGDRCDADCLAQVDRDENRSLLIILELTGLEPTASVIDVDRPGAERVFKPYVIGVRHLVGLLHLDAVRNRFREYHILFRASHEVVPAPGERGCFLSKSRNAVL